MEVGLHSTINDNNFIVYKTIEGKIVDFMKVNLNSNIQMELLETNKSIKIYFQENGGSRESWVFQLYTEDFMRRCFDNISNKLLEAYKDKNKYKIQNTTCSIN